ncbi:MAG: hypothetical protein MZU97_11830 [Bacillus subtilis]|nr:hypothetical protein [Bacillus subtilis]
MASLKLYIEIGKNDSYQALLHAGFRLPCASSSRFRRPTASTSAFSPTWKISESRLKSLQLESSRPKTKAETLYKNIVTVFSIIHLPGREPFKLERHRDQRSRQAPLHRLLQPRQDCSTARSSKPRHTLVVERAVLEARDPRAADRRVQRRRLKKKASTNAPSSISTSSSTS